MRCYFYCCALHDYQPATLDNHDVDYGTKITPQITVFPRFEHTPVGLIPIWLLQEY